MTTINKVYLVIVSSGQWEDYIEQKVFVTTNEYKAKNWCDRFNKIISDNKERVFDFYRDGDYEKKQPFWFSRIEEEPNAFYKGVELR